MSPALMLSMCFEEGRPLRLSSECFPALCRRMCINGSVFEQREIKLTVTLSYERSLTTFGWDSLVAQGAPYHSEGRKEFEGSLVHPLFYRGDPGNFSLSITGGERSGCQLSDIQLCGLSSLSCPLFFIWFGHWAF